MHQVFFFCHIMYRIYVASFLLACYMVRHTLFFALTVPMLGKVCMHVLYFILAGLLCGEVYVMFCFCCPLTCESMLYCTLRFVSAVLLRGDHLRAHVHDRHGHPPPPGINM
jgi:uncharacterized membrane protein